MIADDGLPGHPSCPEDGVLLRDAPGGLRCPACGYEERYEAAKMPETDGTNIIEFPSR